MLNAASGQLSIQFGLRGPNYAVATACASATNAIGDAFKSIQYDEADVMITGGSEAAITPMGISGFANMRALSERNDAPAQASRPFDRDRDGFVLSEVRHACLRGARTRSTPQRAHLRRSDRLRLPRAHAGHITQPDEAGIGEAPRRNGPWTTASWIPSARGNINAHGTSTLLGDQAETTAIKRVFGSHARELSISSTKSQLGHLLGASGGVELVITILAIRDSVIPPTINLDTPDPLCDLDYTPHHLRDAGLRLP